MSELARVLREVRKERQWTLRQAAEATGISNGYLSLIELGRVKAPSPTYLQALANGYGLSFRTLMELAGHPAGDVGAGPAASGGEAGADQAADGDDVRFASVASASITPTGVGGRLLLNRERQRSLGRSERHDVAARPLGDAPDADGPDAEEPDAEGADPLQHAIVRDLEGLSSHELTQVRAFVAGLRAARR